MRSGKASSRVAKNQSIKTARMDAKLDGLKGKAKRDAIKTARLKAKKKQSETNASIAASEALNAQRASDQNVAEGGKVRGNKVKITTANTKEEIQNAQNAANQANNATTSGLTIEDLNKARGSGFRYKKATPFKMNGYGSKNK